MSMAKKNKKKMSPETKQNLKNIFGSLVSNNKVLDGARHNPWWVALIYFVLGIILPIIPILTSGFAAYGSSMYSSRTYGFDTQITDLAISLNENDINLVVDDHKLVDQGDKWETYYGNTTTHGFEYINSSSSQYDFLAFYTKKSGNEFTQYVNSIVEKKYVVGGTDIYVAPSSESSENKTLTYRPNVLIMNPDTIYVAVYKANSAEIAGTVYGDYKTLENGYNLKSLAYTGNVTSSTVIDSAKHIELLANPTYCSGVFTNYKSFLDLTFINNRDRSTLYTCLLALGIYAALGVFMGLMVFILTRGKRNYYNILSFLDCEKINAWAMLTPGLLGMILGFMIPSYAIMFFIILLGLRVMWMSMKQLRPTY